MTFCTEEGWMWFGQKKKNIVLMFFHTCMYTDAHICNGVFFSFIFFFFGLCCYTQACCFPNPQTHLIEEVCVWVDGEGASMLSSQGDTESLPSIISSAPVCVFVFMHRGNHTCLLNLNPCC